MINCLGFTYDQLTVLRLLVNAEAPIADNTLDTEVVNDLVTLNLLVRVVLNARLAFYCATSSGLNVLNQWDAGNTEAVRTHLSLYTR